MVFDVFQNKDLVNLKQRASEAFADIRHRYASLRANEIPKAAFEEIQAALANVGFFGCLIPEEYGGTNRGLLTSTVIMEELAAQGLQSFGPVLNSMAAAGIARFGAETVKRDILPPLARGELKFAIASTETEAGFNVFNVKTYAERSRDRFIVNGSKIYISGIDVADSILVIARTMTREECDRRGLSKTAGISVLLVDPQSEGIERTPLPSHGEGVLTQFSLKLKDVSVPIGHILGDEDHGARVMFRMFNPERTLAAAMGLGMSRYCLDLACEHARNRKVFQETPIGTYQSIQHPLADLAIRQEAVRLMIHRSAWCFDTDVDPNDVASSANAAKYLAAGLAVQAVDAAINTFGGKGFDEEKGIIHLWEAARLLKTAPISDALILNQIAEYVLKLPRSY